MQGTDVIVGGAGIIGLSVALELAQGGFQVTVVERGKAMSEASWAAAGMLAAEDPENPPELTQLALFSRSLYPEYLDRIMLLSGCPVPLRSEYALQASRPGEPFHCPRTDTRSPISAEEAKQQIPGLQPANRSLLWLEEPSLDPRDLCHALPLAAAAAGVKLEQNREILSVESKADSVTVATSNGELSAGTFVNCCGAWAGSLQGPTGTWPKGAIEPRKGQMAALRFQGSSVLCHVLRTPDFYLVPRGDGRIILGATVERAGFDRQIDASAEERLLAQAAELWPPIASAQIIESWIGLRPGTSDNLPLIGAARAPNCWLVTGHFRNGILLAPATAHVVRQCIKGRPPTVSLDLFTPERLSARSTATP